MPPAGWSIIFQTRGVIILSSNINHVYISIQKCIFSELLIFTEVLVVKRVTAVTKIINRSIRLVALCHIFVDQKNWIEGFRELNK